MRHVKLRPNDGTDAEALERLVRAAYADMGSRLAGRPVPDRRPTSERGAG